MGSLQSNQKTPDPSFYNRIAHYAPIMGTTLIIGGILLLIDQKIKTGWIPISIPFFVGIIVLIYSLFLKEEGWILTGFILTGISGALFLVFQPFIKLQNSLLISFGLAFFSLSWLGIFLTISLTKKRYYWWTFFIILISLGISIVFYLTSFTVLSFVLAVSLAIGSALLIWGVAKNILGLQMAGLLVSTIGIGIFNGWNTVGDINGLRDTGNMLVWFSLGWILITVDSKIFKKRFIWWPLIPGGILAMVGSGLYIGGNPENAAAFLQNTGSIGLILLGMYLILLKFGLKK